MAQERARKREKKKTLRDVGREEITAAERKRMKRPAARAGAVCLSSVSLRSKSKKEKKNGLSGLPHNVSRTLEIDISDLFSFPALVLTLRYIIYIYIYIHIVHAVGEHNASSLRFVHPPLVSLIFFSRF